MRKVLSIFIDESGDFGDYDHHSPYYMVAMVLHDQQIDISSEIASLNQRVSDLGFPPHAVHAGPIIRRESIYERYSDPAERKSLLNALFSNVEFRRVKPAEYKLFQVADLICTWELLAIKAGHNAFSKSELELFDLPREFMRNRYKLIWKKKL